MGWEGGHGGPGRLLAGSAISARGGLAGSSGRKVTVRLKSARRKSGLQGAQGLARMGGKWWGAPHCQGPWERLSPRGGQRGQAQDPEPVPGRRAGTLYCKEAVA